MTTLRSRLIVHYLLALIPSAVLHDRFVQFESLQECSGYSKKMPITIAPTATMATSRLNSTINEKARSAIATLGRPTRASGIRSSETTMITPTTAALTPREMPELNGYCGPSRYREHRLAQTRTMAEIQRRWRSPPRAIHPQGSLQKL